MSLAQTHGTHLPLPNKACMLAFALSGLLRGCERCIFQKRHTHKQCVQPARAVSKTAQLRLTLVVAVSASSNGNVLPGQSLWQRPSQHLWQPSLRHFCLKRTRQIEAVEPEAMDGYGGYDYGYDENVRPAENNVSASCCARLPIDPPASQA